MSCRESRCLDVVFIWCHTLWKVCCKLLLQTVSSFLGNLKPKSAKVCECCLLIVSAFFLRISWNHFFSLFVTVVTGLWVHFLRISGECFPNFLNCCWFELVLAMYDAGTLVHRLLLYKRIDQIGMTWGLVLPASFQYLLGRDLSKTSLIGYIKLSIVYITYLSHTS
jgi:hypothetical protein